MKPMHLLWGSLIHSDKLFCHSVHGVYLILTVGVAKTTLYCMGRLILPTVPIAFLQNPIRINGAQ